MTTVPLNTLFDVLNGLIGQQHTITERFYDHHISGNPVMEEYLLTFFNTDDIYSKENVTYDHIPTLEDINRDHGSFSKAVKTLDNIQWLGYVTDWDQGPGNNWLYGMRGLPGDGFHPELQARILAAVNAVVPLPADKDGYEAYTELPEVRKVLALQAEAIWLGNWKEDLSPAIPSLDELTRVYGSYEEAMEAAVRTSPSGTPPLGHDEMPAHRFDPTVAVEFWYEGSDDARTPKQLISKGK